MILYFIPKINKLCIIFLDANGIIQVPTLSKSSQHIIDESLQVKDAYGNIRLAQFKD